MNHVCRRCLTAFSSQPVLFDYIERCIKQQPTKISFGYRDHLKFEDRHMKVPVPKRVYADFECSNQNKTPAEQRDIFRPELFYNYINLRLKNN